MAEDDIILFLRGTFSESKRKHLYAIAKESKGTAKLQRVMVLDNNQHGAHIAARTIDALGKDNTAPYLVGRLIASFELPNLEDKETPKRVRRTRLGKMKDQKPAIPRIPPY